MSKHKIENRIDQTMCRCFFIGTDTALSSIPWEDNKPKFYVDHPLSEQEQVRDHFTKEFVFEFGTAERCGCGFRSEAEGDWDFFFEILDRIELDERQRNHLDLWNYLRENCDQEDMVEIYGCWIGDESNPPASECQVHLDDLKDERFVFRNNCLYTVLMALGD